MFEDLHCTVRVMFWRTHSLMSPGTPHDSTVWWSVETTVSVATVLVLLSLFKRACVGSPVMFGRLPHELDAVEQVKTAISDSFKYILLV